MPSTPLLPIFDLDGTLLDSDHALRAAFVDLGVPVGRITFGHVLEEECRRLGIDMENYLDQYDEQAARPFPGADDLVHALDRWAVCSNKHPRPALSELGRLGWRPDVALFADSFNGPKRLGPVLDLLDVDPEDALFVGDTDHDRRCAADAGVRFVLAGWNTRALSLPGDLVARAPGDVLTFL